MKKIIVTIVFTIISYFIIINNIKVKADNTANFRYVTTSVGENVNSVGINYHCDVEDSYVIYSKTTSFLEGSFETVTPIVNVFQSDKVNGDDETGFAARYVCQANLTDLEENTTYYYKLKSEGNTSKTYSFKTGSTSSNYLNILWTTDLHADAGYNTTSQGNNALKAIAANYSNINLIIQTGDQNDRGGYEANWQAYFNGYTIFENILTASIPGNHEYYHSNSGSYISPLYYNQFYNNPKNGPDVRLNSTYYFKYGNILFIMLDTIKKEYVEEQRAWFKEVCENNPSQWIIVGSHSGCISMGSYTSDAAWMSNNWKDLFEEYQVDLCLSGHEHIYIRSDLMYKNKYDENLGITYLVGSAGAHKAYSANENKDKYTYLQTNYSSNIITLTKDNLKVALYDKNGQLQSDYVFTLTPKRPAKVTATTDKALLSSAKVSYDKENETIKVSWAQNYYGNVKEIKATITDDYGTTDSFTSPIMQTKMCYKEMPGFFSDRNYQVKIEIVKKNGTILTKEEEINNLIPYKLTLELFDGIIENPDDWTLYLSGKRIKLPTPTKESAEFAGWFDNTEYSGEAWKYIAAETTGELALYAKWIKLYTLKYVTNSDQVINDYIYKEGGFSLPDLDDGEKVFAGWYLEKDLINKVEEVKQGEEKDLTVYAKWLNIYLITYDLDGGSLADPIVSYIEGDTITLPTPTKNKAKFLYWEQDGKQISEISADTKGDLHLKAVYKKGCGNKASIIIGITSIFIAVSLLFRKRR